jgi:phosphate transport system substrate-binding protein
MRTHRRLTPALAFLCLPALGGGAVVARGAQLETAALTPYQPQVQVHGVLRVYGSGLGGLIADWQAGFSKYHQDAKFQNVLPTSDAALPALITGVADLAPDGGEAALTETLAFYESYGYHPTAITVATGAYDVEGHTNGLIVYVNERNPVDKLTLDQLDGIFGEQRTAGLRGFQWDPVGGRSADRDIRTWGQLGLAGAWAKHGIQTYGHAPSGTSRFFQLTVLKNSDKWNPNFREYVESGSKMIAEGDREQQLGLRHMLGEELARDPYGIAWTVLPQARGIQGLKAVALAMLPSGPYVMPSRESFQNRSYPLTRSVYIFINRPPGSPVEARTREFLRFVLSREGQQIVAANGGYLPLPEAVADQQRRKLD